MRFTRLAIFIHKDDHPHADCAGVTKQRCAVQPTSATFLGKRVDVGIAPAGTCQPSDFCSHATAFLESMLELCSDALRAANATHKR